MPQPPVRGSFEWTTVPWGRALRCRPLADVAPHLFTTRQPPLSGPAAAVADGWSEIAGALGVPVSAVVRLTQVHGDRVVIVPDDAPCLRATGTWADADAAVTDRDGIVLAVNVADCVPILLADARTGAVAAVHAGWRGTAAGVSRAAVEALAGRYGVDPGDLTAAVGPSIGPCCYQVGTDVVDCFLEAGAAPRSIAEWFTVSPAPARRPGVGLGAEALSRGTAVLPGKLWLDTWRANADQLAAAGVSSAHIHVSGMCTGCHADLLHSYRVDGPRAGRMAGAIRRAPMPRGPVS